jgi:hypothetical protein
MAAAGADRVNAAAEPAVEQRNDQKGREIGDGHGNHDRDQWSEIALRPQAQAHFHADPPADSETG